MVTDYIYLVFLCLCNLCFIPFLKYFITFIFSRFSSSTIQPIPIIQPSTNYITDIEDEDIIIDFNLDKDQEKVNEEDKEKDMDNTIKKRDRFHFDDFDFLYE